MFEFVMLKKGQCSINRHLALFQFSEVGKCQAILTFLTGLSILGSGIENTNISYILPYAKCDLSLTNGEQGLLCAMSYAETFLRHILGDFWPTPGVERMSYVWLLLVDLFSHSYHALLLTHFP